MHANVADIRFFAKSAADPIYCLLIVDLFTSNLHIPHEIEKPFEKINRFSREYFQKKKKNVSMHLQTNQEFQQNEIKKLNTKFNVKMFSSRIRGGKAFAAEQKIREFKNLLSKRKKIHQSSSTKRLNSKKIIQETTDNLNSIAATKYGYPPGEVEEKV